MRAGGLRCGEEMSMPRPRTRSISAARLPIDVGMLHSDEKRWILLTRVGAALTGQRQRCECNQAQPAAVASGAKRQTRFHRSNFQFGGMRTNELTKARSRGSA